MLTNNLLPPATNSLNNCKCPVIKIEKKFNWEGDKRGGVVEVRRLCCFHCLYCVRTRNKRYSKIYESTAMIKSSWHSVIILTLEPIVPKVLQFWAIIKSNLLILISFSQVTKILSYFAYQYHLGLYLGNVKKERCGVKSLSLKKATKLYVNHNLECSNSEMDQLISMEFQGQIVQQSWKTGVITHK